MANKFLSTGAIPIKNGPGKFDFMNSNFDFKTIEITCVVNGRDCKFKAKVEFASSESGATEKWIGMIMVFNPDVEFSHERRAYYYNSLTRQGTISPASQKWKLINE
jgi:hypothetical protein